MSQVFNLKRRISDVIKWECNYQYTRSTITVSNTGSSDLELLAGQQYVASTGTLFTGASEAIPLQQSVTIGGTFTPAIPEVYQIQIGGTWAANDTLVIGSTTFTAKADPTTASNEFSAGGTGDVIVQDIKAAGLAVTGFTVTYDGDTIILTQTVPGTGSSPTVTPTSTSGTAVKTNTQSYKAADTITISGTTYTCVSGASTSEGTTEFEPSATPEEIAAIIVDDPLTISNFTVTRDGAAVLITQTVPGTGSALTAGDVTVVSATGTATLATVHEYTAASATDFDCILVYPEVIPPGDSRVVTVLSNGPAIVDINVVMAANASANTQEAVVKRLGELGIKITEEPSVTAYQET